MKLLPYQRRWIDDTSPLKIVEKSRRIGMSWTEALHAVLHAATGAGNIYYQSYDKEMTRGFIQDCVDWAHRLALAVPMPQWHDQVFRLSFRGACQILAMSSAPRVWRSRGRPGDIAVIDEAAWVGDLGEMLRAARGFRIWDGRMHILSTHRGVEAEFCELVREVRDGERPGSLHRVTFDDAITDGLHERIFGVADDAAAAAWAADIRAEFGEDAAEELDCQPDARTGAWLPWDLIRAAEHESAGDPSLTSNRGQVYIGNDIARRRDLWVAWVIQVLDGVAWSREVRVLEQSSFKEQDASLDELVQEYKPVRIVMDQTGIGEKPVEDAADRYGASRVEGVILSEPRRTAVATTLLQRMEAGSLRIPARADIRADLYSVKRSADRRPVNPPHRRGAVHADCFWAAALACHGAASNERSVRLTVRQGDRREAVSRRVERGIRGARIH